MQQVAEADKFRKIFSAFRASAAAIRASNSALVPAGCDGSRRRKIPEQHQEMVKLAAQLQPLT